MLKRGVMATNYGGTYHNVIKLSPPLVITKEQLDYGIKVIDESLALVENTL
jgi:4-aminobutyrate aminotransferase-like enzyme